MTGSPKQITGYCEPWTVRAGESVRLMASSHQRGPAEVDITQIVCGDPTRYGPGFDERPVPEAGSGQLILDEQPLTPGSYGVAALDGLPSVGRLGLRLWVMPTLLDRPARIATLCARVAATPVTAAPVPAAPASATPAETQAEAWLLVEALRLELRDGRAVVSSAAVDGGLEAVIDARPLTRNRWYLFDAELDLAAGVLCAGIATARSDSPGRDATEGDRLSDLAAQSLGAEPGGDTHEGVRWHGVGTTAGFEPQAGGGVLAPVSLWLAGGPGGERCDGRLARPMLRCGEAGVSWDFSADPAGRSVPAEVAGCRVQCGPVVLHQLPTRAITGPAWDGTAHRWSDNLSHYDAVHFHHDDLYDAGWHTTVETTLPHDLTSGIYAFRVRSEFGQDRVPIFVRPAASAPTADVALLMPTATYLAYANHRMLFEGADFIPTKTRLRPEHAYIRDHPELGRSHYEKHPDGSGVMFSSRRRPVLNLRPGADGWNFTPDTDINAFLEHLEVGHDIVTDEDLHAEGLEAIAPYRVLVTGSHPEYWSTAMLDALADWQRAGGRLMYLGGNGFYWRVAFSDEWPGAVELRRAEDGVRNWQTGPGESYHAWGGEYGGLWRRQGRAPNEICGVGFAAQGFEQATWFVRDPGTDASRAAWILDGVPGERIGTSGLGGGAAGQEVDRYDAQLGSPSHAVVLASATTFGPDMLRTKEEFEASVYVPTPDPMVRADIVFYETPNGGAVFSVGSISWFGALARDGFDNDVARITANVVRRFADPAPFPMPPESP
ncbi:N,N-dimethylformamidase beta subunit family domain-containing protein [Candidatus Poriferisodalis sp.]|uniref:N,N-dimethylformamidase beta subunit family domain-containing protein n=1 Tax=Candidatus Poriferisodalis sp. TaxID=3101277 RepID=UPI003B024FA0